jgi:hypothetical protein
MAEHAAPEYATASGNDYAAHEHTYEAFVHMSFIGTLLVASIVVGLAIGATTGHWLVSFAVFVVATIAAIQGMMSKGQTASYAALVFAGLCLALTAGGSSAG